VLAALKSETEELARQQRCARWRYVKKAVGPVGTLQRSNRSSSCVRISCSIRSHVASLSCVKLAIVFCVQGRGCGCIACGRSLRLVKALQVANRTRRNAETTEGRQPFAFSCASQLATGGPFFHPPPRRAPHTGCLRATTHASSAMTSRGKRAKAHRRFRRLILRPQVAVAVYEYLGGKRGEGGATAPRKRVKVAA
jgi:hypothetical protein